MTVRRSDRSDLPDLVIPAICVRAICNDRYQQNMWFFQAGPNQQQRGPRNWEIVVGSSEKSPERSVHVANLAPEVNDVLLFELFSQVPRNSRSTTPRFQHTMDHKGASLRGRVSASNAPTRASFVSRLT